MEAYCCQEHHGNMSDLSRFIDTVLQLHLYRINEGPGLGNQNHSTGMLMQSPEVFLHGEGMSGDSENMHM
eukprot:13651193-Heterocapsa_arctica.AAC.1